MAKICTSPNISEVLFLPQKSQVLDVIHFKNNNQNKKAIAQNARGLLRALTMVQLAVTKIHQKYFKAIQEIFENFGGSVTLTEL